MRVTLDANLRVHDPGPHLRRLCAMARWQSTAGMVRRVVRLWRWDEAAGTLTLPRGLWPLPPDMGPFEVEDSRLALPEVSFGWRGPALDDFQKRAAGKLYRNAAGMLIAPGGCGKTLMALRCVAAWKQPALWVVDSASLADQALSVAQRVFRLPASAYGTIADGEYRPGTHFTVGLRQTLITAGRRRDCAQRFGTVFVDECFVAGTRVGGRPIEDIKPGDRVPSWDGHSAVLGVVTGTSVHLHVGNLCAVEAGGRKIICTPNHPILTRRGWVNAEQLRPTDEILVRAARRLRDLRRKNRGTAAKALPKVRRSGPHDTSLPGMHPLRGLVLSVQAAVGRVEEEGPGLLQPAMRPKGARGRACGAPGDGAHQATDSPAQAGEADLHPREQGGRHGDQACAGDGWSTCDWGQWSPTPRAPANLGGNPRVANGARGTNGDLARFRLSDRVQGGHRQPRGNDRRRGRWQFAQFPIGEGAGRQEGRLPRWAGLDRVEILEPGSAGRPAGMRGPVPVYNLQIAGTHTYVANGVIVHNCDLSAATTYVRVLCRFPAAIRAGCTATPDRADNLHPVVTAVFGAPRVRVSLQEAQAAGRFVPPRLVTRQTRRRYSWGGNYPALQADRAADHERNRMIALDVAREVRGGHACLVLVQLLDHAAAMVGALRSVGVHPLVVTGKVAAGKRERTLDAIRQGSRCLVATKLVNRGVDLPVIDRVFLADSYRAAPTVEQQVYRVTRTDGRKRDAVVFDYWDDCDQFRSQAEARRRLFVSKGWRVDGA